MTYSLYRTDGAGDSGPISNIFRRNPNSGELEQKSGRPQLGWGVKVGSPYARSYQAQDWWATTPVTEIVEESDKKVVFKTRSGSTYIWEEF